MLSAHCHPVLSWVWGVLWCGRYVEYHPTGDSQGRAYTRHNVRVAFHPSHEDSQTSALLSPQYEESTVVCDEVCSRLNEFLQRHAGAFAKSGKAASQERSASPSSTPPLPTKASGVREPSTLEKQPPQPVTGDNPPSPIVILPTAHSDHDTVDC